MSSSPILPYSDGVSPLAAAPIRTAEELYKRSFTALTDLDALDTRYMLTGTKVTFTMGSPPVDETWRLYNGTATPDDETNQRDAYNSDATADDRYWVKVAGY